MQNYLGTIIEESLGNKDVLNDVKILSTKIEPIEDQYQKAKEYGVSLGIPEYQVDFSPDIK